MSAPLSAIITATRQSQTPTELQQAAAACVKDVANIYGGVGYAANAIAGRYALHGGDAILAQMAQDYSPQVAQSFAAALGLLSQIWPQFSDEPFPELPAEAVPVDAPAEPEVTE